MLSDTLTNEANMQMALFCAFFFLFISQRLKVQMIKKKVFQFFSINRNRCFKKKSLLIQICYVELLQNYPILQIKSNFELIIVKLLNMQCLKKYRLQFNVQFFFLLIFNALIIRNCFSYCMRNRIYALMMRYVNVYRNICELVVK